MRDNPVGETTRLVSDALTPGQIARQTSDEAWLTFIRECVRLNPGGYTDEFRFLLERLDAARTELRDAYAAHDEALSVIRSARIPADPEALREAAWVVVRGWETNGWAAALDDDIDALRAALAKEPKP